MSRSERDKGRKGEAEVAAIYRDHGLEVRGLEGEGDHAIVCGAGGGLRLHSESKRHETARPWAWFAQAAAEAPSGTVPVVAFRRNRSAWMAMLELQSFAAIAAAAAWAIDNGYRPHDGG